MIFRRALGDRTRIEAHASFAPSDTFAQLFALANVTCPLRKYGDGPGSGLAGSGVKHTMKGKRHSFSV